MLIQKSSHEKKMKEIRHQLLNYKSTKLYLSSLLWFYYKNFKITFSHKNQHLLNSKAKDTLPKNFHNLYAMMEEKYGKCEIKTRGWHESEREKK